MMTSVYPTLADPVSVPNGESVAWKLATNTTEIIPVNTIDDEFDIHYVDIGSISNSDVFELIIYKGLAGAEIEIARNPHLCLLTYQTLASKGTAARTVTVKLHCHTY